MDIFNTSDYKVQVHSDYYRWHDIVRIYIDVFIRLAQYIVSRIKMLTLHWVISLFLLWSRATGYMVEDINQLLEDKLANYNKDVRPLKNQSNALNLTLQMELLSILEFDEVNQKLQIAAVIEHSWYDELIAWNPADYGELEQFMVNSRHFWTPSLVLTNSVENLNKIGEPWFDIHFYSDGGAFFYPGEVFSASCITDVTHFPWDIHECDFNFMVWGAPSNIIFLKSVSNKVLTNYFRENGGWSFEDSKVEIISRDGSWEMFFRVEITVRRKSGFVIVNMVAPIIFLSALNLLTFLIPTDSGERISYSITVLLALAVFLTIVGDNLPRISHPMALFGYYLVGILFMSGSIIITTLISLNIYHKDENEKITYFWMTFVHTCSGKHKLSNTLTDKSVGQNKELDNQFANEKKNISSSWIPFEHIFSRNSKRSSILPDNSVDKSQVADEKDSNVIERAFEECKDIPQETYNDALLSITWKEISGLFDKVCFIAFTIILTISTIVFFSVLYTASR